MSCAATKCLPNNEAVQPVTTPSMAKQDQLISNSS